MDLERKKIVIAEIGLDSQARDVADQELTEEAADSWRITKFWKNTLFRDYYRQKKINAAREGAKATGDLFHTSKGSTKETRAKSFEVKNSVLTQFLQEYDEAIHRDAGEYRNKLGAEGEEGAFKEQLQNLLKEYVNKKDVTAEDDLAFQEEKTRILNSRAGLSARTELRRRQEELMTLKGQLDRQEISQREYDSYVSQVEQDLARLEKDTLEPDRVYADNLLEIAKEFRQTGEHEAGIEALIAETDVIIGRAKTGVRTEAEYSACDRILEKLRSVPVLGALVEKPVIAGAIAALLSISTAGAKMAARATGFAAAGLVGSAAVGAVMAGSVKSQQLKEQRRQHLRDMAKGKSFNPDAAPLRKEMQEYAYETRDAKSLMNELEDLLYEIDPDNPQRRNLKNFDQAELDLGLSLLADINARIALSDRHKIDLISYSDEALVSEERTQLDFVRANARLHLSLFSEPGKLEELKRKSMKNFIEGDQGIEKKNALFEKMKSNAAWKAAGVGLVAGVLLGAGAQQIGAEIKDYYHIDRGETALGSLYNYLNNEAPSFLGGAHPETILNHDYILPDGVELARQADGSMSLMRGGEEVVKNLTFNYPKGGFTAEALAALKSQGISAENISKTVTEEVTKTVKSTAREYAAEHGFQKVHRVGWYDNDTPLPTVDYNEAQLHWGGYHGTGIDKNTEEIVYSIKRMTSDGSFSRGFSADVKELQGTPDLKMIFSLSRDSQASVWEVPIDAKGNAVIDPDSEMGKLFFNKTADGHVEFLGKYAEVVEVVGEKDGVEQVRVLATDVGEGLKDFTTSKVEKTFREVLETKLTVPSERFFGHTDIPPFIPVWHRNELEPVKNRGYETIYPPPVPPEEKNPPHYPYYGSGTAKNILEGFTRRGIELDPYTIEQRDGKKVFLDKNGNEVQRDVSREKERIEKYLSGQDASYQEELEEFQKQLPPMHEDCRVSVIIPARFEAGNLANLLDQYSGQMDLNSKTIDKNLFEINVIVNRKKSEANDGSMAVIEAWKDKNPGVRVNAIEVAFDDDKACVGLARKYITDLTLLRSNERTKQSKPLYIETEDADLFSVDRRTVFTLLKRFDAEPELDILRGIQDRQPEVMKDNDLLFFQRRLWDFMEVFLRDPKLRPDKNPDADFVWHRVISGGWNTAYTAEAYAEIGGYDSHMRIGEDMDIGQKISVLRGTQDEKSGNFVPNTHTAKASGLRSNSSPRRFIDALARDISPYDDFDNQALKNASLPDLMLRIEEFKVAKKEQLEKYQRTLEISVGFLKKLYPDSSDRWQKIFTKVLSFGMGLKKTEHFTMDNEVVRLTEKGMEKIIERLKNYRDKRGWLKGYARQNTPGSVYA